MSRVIHDNHGGTLHPDTAADRVILDHAYTRDLDGRLIADDPTGLAGESTQAYHYDPNGRLVGAGIPTPLAEIPTYGYLFRGVRPCCRADRTR